MTSQPEYPSKAKPLAGTTDMETYMSHLDDWDVTEEEKLEFLSLLKSILSSFVDMGFGIYTDDLPMTKPSKSIENHTLISNSVVKYNKPQDTKTQHKTGARPPSKNERSRHASRKDN